MLKDEESDGQIEGMMQKTQSAVTAVLQSNISWQFICKWCFIFKMKIHFHHVSDNTVERIYKFNDSSESLCHTLQISNAHGVK